MFRPQSIFAGIRALFRKKRVEREMDEELRGYLDAAMQEKMRSGMSQEQALRAARVEMGSVEAVKEEIRTTGWESTLETLWQDIRYGLRQLKRNPGFTVVAVLTLALGIGANSAIFNVAQAALLRAWPLKDPGRCVSIVAETRDGFDTFSYADYRDLVDQSKSLEGIFAFSRHCPILQTGTEPQSILAEYVSPNYFAVLGIPPALGRGFSQAGAEEQPAVVISDRLWHRVFHGDPSLVGKPIVLHGRSYTVIGVAPPRVRGFEPDMWTDVWLLAATEMGEGGLKSRENGDFELIGRMRSGVTAGEVRTELDMLGRRLAEAYPAADKGRNIRVITEPDRLRKAMVPTLLLMSSVGLILIICCANIAGLVLARAETRRREIAVRLALGAGRWRLVRQLLTESALLALGGAGLGLLLASWLFHLQPLLMPPSDLPQELDLRMDGSLILFTLGVALIAVVFIGLVPALQASKAAVVPALKGEARVDRRARFSLTFRNVLVAGEIGLSVVLVAASGLLVRSLLYTEGITPGFGVRKNLLFFQRVEPSSPFYQQTKEKISALPGVKRVSMALHLMLTDPESGMTQRVTVPGVEWPPDQPNVPIRFNAVDPGYFQTVGTKILEGREFTLADGPAAARVVVISRAMAGRFWKGSDPVGRHIIAEGRDCVIVGVAEDAKIRLIHESPLPYMYFPIAQVRSWGATLIVEAAGEVLTLAPMIRREVRKMDPSVPIDVSTLHDVMSNVMWVDRTAAGFATVLGSLAVVLAAIGLYGVMAYLANRRRNEFGVRMALGATRRDLLRLVIWDGLKLSVAGTMVGLPIALGVARLMATLLYGVSPGDPGVFAIGAGVAIFVAVVATYIPARRATKVDPMVALRYE
jgi:predicted permease